MKSRAALPTAVALLAVIVFSINLRLGVSAIAPALGHIRHYFGVSTSVAGILTALPGFMFAIMGWCAVPLARRVGVTPTLIVGAVAITLGTALRPVAPLFSAFLILTVLVVGGIALGNVLLPAWIKAHFPAKTAVVLMTAYTTVLGMSGAVGPLSALLFEQEDPDAWRGMLGVWAVPAVIMLCVWILLAKRYGKDVPRSPALSTSTFPPTEVPMYRSPTAVTMMLFFGVQSATAYVQMGWLPQILTDRGVSAATASIALSTVGVINIVGGLIMPTVIARTRRLTPLPVVLALFSCAGWLGIFMNATAAPITWSVLMGIGGMCFPLALALLTARTKDPLITARLSGFVQPGGYLIAGAIPLAVGFIFSALGNWDAIVLGLAVLAIIQAGLGVVAARHTLIDDELAHARKV